jgi:uncharacterized protein (TIGR03067 family)
MQRRIVLLFTTVLLLGAAQDAKKDLDQLQGSWQVTSAEREGKPLDTAKNDRLIFKGDQLTVQGKTGDESTFMLDPAQKPAAIDITPAKGPARTIRGIYQIEGDTLKLCFGDPSSERPKEFTAKAGTGFVLVTLKREK